MTTATMSALLQIDPLELYDPTTAMDEVHRSLERLRFVRKPNQVGGSFMLAAEVWWTALDSHPYRDPIGKGPIWVMLADLKDGYITFCEKLWQNGSRSRLAEGCHYIEGVGFRYRSQKMLMLDNGRRIEFKSGTQDQMALESGTIAALFIDEPPLPGHMSAAMQRCAVSQAPVLMNFTPVGRPVDWLRLRIEGDPETGEPPSETWACFRPTLTVEDCTTVGGRELRSQENIDAQIESMSPWQVSQRQFGEWEGETQDRRFLAFSEGCIFEDLESVEFTELRLGMDHGEGTGKQVCYLIGYHADYRNYTVIGEAVAPANSTPEEVAESIVAMLESRGVSPYEIAMAYGDINSAGLAAGGGRYNGYIENGIAKAYGYDVSPITISTPNKRGGSVDAGEAAMNHAMKEGRFFIHSSCKAGLKALKNYTGPKDPKYKDQIDAMRYAVNDRLLEARKRETRVYMQR